MENLIGISNDNYPLQKGNYALLEYLPVESVAEFVRHVNPATNKFVGVLTLKSGASWFTLPNPENRNWDVAPKATVNGEVHKMTANADLNPDIDALRRMTQRRFLVRLHVNEKTYLAADADFPASFNVENIRGGVGRVRTTVKFVAESPKMICEI